MNFNKKEAEIFIPDGTEETAALSRTTFLCIAAHHDDIEIMAYGGIAECYDKADKWFTGVVVTDGAGSPRSGIYKNYTDKDMKEVRKKEQKTASVIGKYSAQLLLSYPSCEVKDSKNEDLISELALIIEKCAPQTVFTHNLADKHDTHVAVALRTISAIKRLPIGKRPKKVYALEVWRSLDWLCDEDKVLFNTAPYPQLAASLINVYKSQITGGKRYDLAALGRRAANATFFASHETDMAESLSYAIDITPLIDEEISPENYILNYIDKFKGEINDRIVKLL